MTIATFVAQVSKPAVSPISKSAGPAKSYSLRVWKPATQHLEVCATSRTLCVPELND